MGPSTNRSLLAKLLVVVSLVPVSIDNPGDFISCQFGGGWGQGALSHKPSLYNPRKLTLPVAGGLTRGEGQHKTRFLPGEVVKCIAVIGPIELGGEQDRVAVAALEIAAHDHFSNLEIVSIASVGKRGLDHIVGIASSKK